MTDAMLFLLILAAVFAGGLLLTLIVVHASGAGADEAWRKFAERHRLQFVPRGGKHKTPLITGQLEGRQLTVGLEKAGNNNAGMTTVALELRGELPTGLAFQAQKTQGKVLKKMLHGKDVETGDRAFDDRVVVKIGEPRALARYLSQARKRGLLQLVEVEGSLEDGKLQVKRQGRVNEVEELEQIFRTLREVAPVVDTA